MASRPHFREFDEMPTRGTDIHVRILGFTYDGDGRMLIVLLIAIGLLLVGGGSVVALYFHDNHQLDAHPRMLEASKREHDAIVGAVDKAGDIIEKQTYAIGVQTCVSTLNEKEKREFRLEGKYCRGKLLLEDQGVLK